MEFELEGSVTSRSRLRDSGVPYQTYALSFDDARRGERTKETEVLFLLQNVWVGFQEFRVPLFFARAMG